MFTVLSLCPKLFIFFTDYVRPLFPDSLVGRITQMNLIVNIMKDQNQLRAKGVPTNDS